MNSAPPVDPPKKPYRPPALQVYGSIAALTQQLGTNGKNDPGGSSQTKTG